MEMAWNIVAFALIGLVIVLCAAWAWGAYRWRSATKSMHARLEAARRPMASPHFSHDDLSGLPAPVQHYMRAVLREHQPVVSAATIEHAGVIRGGTWRAFTSTERFVIHRPGFDWEARVAAGPGIAVRVHDAYIAGEGMLRASLLGLVPLANVRGTPEAARAELMRFLAEAVWFPTALLPSQGVRWEPVDERSAKATLVDGDTTVTLLFRFNEIGLAETVRAEARGRAVSGGVVPTPWECRLGKYELRDGMRIPIEAEVAWLPPAGPRPYWRGRITKVIYEFAR